MWSELFNKAIAILDSAKISDSKWTFGGGTALALYFQHRESKDIDIFLTDAQYIPFLSPRLNRIVEKMTIDYTEASNFVKLKFSEGEVDFIVAPHLTKDYYYIKEINGRQVRIETPEEIITKKLFYRAESLKIRDVIDVTVVYRERESELKQYYSMICSKIDLIMYRWKKLKFLYSDEVKQLKIFEKTLVEQAPVLFEKFLMDVNDVKLSG